MERMEGKEYDVLLKTYNKRLSKTPTKLNNPNMDKILSDEMIKEKISQTEILESNSYPSGQAYYNGACFARRTYQSEIEKRDKRIEELESNINKLSDNCSLWDERYNDLLSKYHQGTSQPF